MSYQEISLRGRNMHNATPMPKGSTSSDLIMLDRTLIGQRTIVSGNLPLYSSSTLRVSQYQLIKSSTACRCRQKSLKNLISLCCCAVGRHAEQPLVGDSTTVVKGTSTAACHALSAACSCSCPDRSKLGSSQCVIGAQNRTVRTTCVGYSTPHHRAPHESVWLRVI